MPVRPSAVLQTLENSQDQDGSRKRRRMKDDCSANVATATTAKPSISQMNFPSMASLNYFSDISPPAHQYGAPVSDSDLVHKFNLADTHQQSNHKNERSTAVQKEPILPGIKLPPLRKLHPTIPPDPFLDQKPFVSCVCGKVFQCQDDLNTHELWHPSHTKVQRERELAQDVDGTICGCGRLFARANELATHLKSESGRACIADLLEEGALGRVPMARPCNRSSTQFLETTPGTTTSNFNQYPADLTGSVTPPTQYNDPGNGVGNTSRTGEAQHSSSDLFSSTKQQRWNQTKMKKSLYQSTNNAMQTMDWSTAYGFPIFGGDDFNPPPLSLADEFAAWLFSDDHSGDRSPTSIPCGTASHTIGSISNVKGIFAIETTPAAESTLARTNSCLGPKTPQDSPSEKELSKSTATSRNVTFSDSGYHSDLGRDADSVCSVDSIGSSLGLSQNFLQDFVTYFGDLLIDQAAARSWYTSALARYDVSVVDRRLDELLKQYSVDLLLPAERIAARPPGGNVGICIDAQKIYLNRRATKLVRRYRPKIARYFREHASLAPVDHDSMASRLQDLGKQLSLSEKTGLFAKQNPDFSNECPGDPNDPDDVSDVESENDFADLEPIKDFLVSGKAFKTLCSSLKNLYFDRNDTMERVRRRVTAGLVDDHLVQKSDEPFTNYKHEYTTRFELHWHLKVFLSSQYGKSTPPIGSIVVLAGSALYAQATTYAKYLQVVWPKHCALFLHALQAALRGQESGKKNTASASVGTETITFHFSSGLREPDVCSVRGTTEFIVDIAQMIAFTGTALNLSPFGENLVYGRVEVEPHHSPHAQFQMDFRTEELHSSEDSCWLSLFCGASIARDFPIPDRGDELGLEIPTEMMAAIAGARHAVEYGGGLVIKGFSCMFVPIEKTEDRVQWHLLSSDDAETRMSYHDLLERCANRATLDQVNFANLAGTRAIVGWCTTAWSALGSRAVDYDNIDYSTAQKANSGIKCSGGSIGFQQFGLAQLDFSLGARDGKCHFQRTNGPYKRIISAAERTPVILYDVSEKRAWLVSAVEVILHMIHHRHVLEPFELHDKSACIPNTDIYRLSAAGILLANAGMDLSDIEVYKFKDVVTSIWSLLEFLVDQRVSQNRGLGLTVPTKMRDIIQGYEFKAVVQERSPFQQKQSPILKSSGGWPALIQDIDALVLFASGLGNLIRPVRDDVNNRHLCHMWSTVPKDKDYLAARVQMLNDLYESSGHRLDRTFLTSTKLQWHKGRSSLFEPCTNPGTYICKCSRLQQVIANSALGEVSGPGPLMESGAVIFGQSESPLYELGFTPSKPKVYGIYSQPNSALEMETSSPKEADDTFSSTASESDDIGRDFSDATEGTATTLTSYSSRGNLEATSEADSPDHFRTFHTKNTALTSFDDDIQLDYRINDTNNRAHSRKRAANQMLSEPYSGNSQSDHNKENDTIGRRSKGLTETLSDAHLQPRKRRV